MKKYKTIFFDWDGTAVKSRTAPTEQLIERMIPLLKQGVQLIIISGTSYKNIAGGVLHQLIPTELLKNVYLGLGRGVVNIQLHQEGPLQLSSFLPSIEDKLLIDQTTYLMHDFLYRNYEIPSDIVFTRDNYCKLDLIPSHDRKLHLYFDTSEIKLVNDFLLNHHYVGGLLGLIDKSIEIAKDLGILIQATTDAKFLEIGNTTKSDNVNFFFKHLELCPEECCFVGDEYSYLEKGIRGSDDYMYTSLSMKGDFYDVNENPHLLADYVFSLKGGVARFHEFLKDQENQNL